WMAGYFVILGLTPMGGFGFYRMDLLALVQPLGIWSVFGATGHDPGEYEGFAYLGAGMLALAVFLVMRALVLRLRGVASPVTAAPRVFDLPLILLAIGLLIYAASNEVSFGVHQLYTYPVPDALATLTGSFRASGRFAWPVVYLIMLALLAALLVRVPRKQAVAVLAVLLALQAFDLSKASTFLKMRWAQSWPSPAQSAFWNNVPKQYKRIAFVVPENETPNYVPLALLASGNGMTVNGGHFARVDPAKLEGVIADLHRTVATGAYRADTLYVFSHDALWLQAHETFRGPGFIGKVDGYAIVAPGYAGCVETCGMVRHLPSDRFRVLHSVNFDSGDFAQYALAGWSVAEPGGRWTEGNKAVLQVALDPAQARLYSVQLTFAPFLAPSHPAQRVEVYVNGVRNTGWNINTTNDYHKEIIIDPQALPAPRDKAIIELRLPDAKAPRDVGANEDGRVLGIYVKKMTVTAQ
ncbi:MAG TPA: hypothetical protein VIT92_06540, partial [Burkholderiaceae bacterium]